jgi:hypothetical protein
MEEHAMIAGRNLSMSEIVACAALAIVTAMMTTLIFVNVLFSAPMVA